MRRTWIASAALVAGGTLAGGIVAGSLSANAATGSSSSAPSQGTAPTQGTVPGNGMGPGRAPGGAMPHGHGTGETLVTGHKAATLEAAALEAVPGASADRVETDSGDAAYEVHLTKADGSQVTVKFDSSLKETGVESGMGR